MTLDGNITYQNDGKREYDLQLDPTTRSAIQASDIQLFQKLKQKQDHTYYQNKIIS
jgi:hypothetical protein